MRSLKSAILVTIIVIFIFQIPVNSQELILPENYPDYEFSVSNSPDDGYLFITSRPQSTKYPAYLQIVDNYGTPVFYRYLPGQAGNLTLQRNDLLSYSYNSVGTPQFFIMDSSYVVVDSVSMDDYILDTHDFIAMENGHFLIFGLDIRTVDMSVIVEGGKPNASLEGCIIRELDENKDVVFEWNSWDHYDITDTYRSLTRASIVLVHPNTLEIDLDGNILLIARAMNEITKISRQTGEIIWRLGGKNNQFDFADTTHLFHMPHDIRALSNGNYTLFDNGKGNVPEYSRAVEYVLDEVNKTIEMVWEYDANKEIYGPSGGSAQLLPSGNTIICYGGQMNHPSMIEVHPDGSKAWQLDYQDENSSGRALKFPWKTNLFELSTYSIDFGEYEYVPRYYLLTVTNHADHNLILTGYSTHTSAFKIQESFPITIPAGGETDLTVAYEPIGIQTGYITDVMTINSDINSDTLVQRIAQQVKLMGTQEDFNSPIGSISPSLTDTVHLDASIYIEFDEAIRLPDDTELTYLNINPLVTLKKDDVDGEDVAFDAALSTKKNLITITPGALLDHTQTFYVSISNNYEDYSDNQGVKISTTFSTIDMTSPVGTINPQDGSINVDPDSDLIIQFDEPVRNFDNSVIVDNNLDTLVILKIGNEAGANVPFNATINIDKTIITVSPESSLSENTGYYIAIWRGVEDSHNNLADTVYSQFTTGLSSKIKSPDDFSLKVYPNPGNGIYQIRFPDKQERMIRVTNLVGKTIFRKTNLIAGEYVLDLSDKPNNIYLLFIEEPDSGKTHTRKLIKQ